MIVKTWIFGSVPRILMLINPFLNILAFPNVQIVFRDCKFCMFPKYTHVDARLLASDIATNREQATKHIGIQSVH